MTDEQFINECYLRAQRELLKGEGTDHKLASALMAVAVRMELIQAGVDPDEEIEA